MPTDIKKGDYYQSIRTPGLVVRVNEVFTTYVPHAQVSCEVVNFTVINYPSPKEPPQIIAQHITDIKREPWQTNIINFKKVYTKIPKLKSQLLFDEERRGEK